MNLVDWFNNRLDTVEEILPELGLFRVQFRETKKCGKKYRKEGHKKRIVNRFKSLGLGGSCAGGGQLREKSEEFWQYSFNPAFI